MKSLTLTFPLSLLAALCLPVQAQIPPVIVRPDFSNLSTASTAVQTKNPGIMDFQGHILRSGRPAGDYPTGGGIRLREATIGQPFATWVPDPGFALAQKNAARAALYPAFGATKADVDKPLSQGGTAFRYKYLLYAPDSGRTVADFGSIGTWYGDPERAVISTQINNLFTALAFAPLDTGLRHTLLDAYTDRAVAEMQFVKTTMVEIGKKRLALTLTSAYIIDEEITAYTSMVNKLGTILAAYSNLLNTPVDGVDPADFDSRAMRGTPLGYYIFKTEQPSRNAVASQYFDNAGTLTSVPSYDPILKEVPRGAPEPFTDTNGSGFYDTAEDFTDSNGNHSYDAGEPFTDSNGNGLRDAGEPFTDTNGNGLRDDPSVLFAGFKDYTTLLEVMAAYVQRSSELAELLGMRRASSPANDMTTARNLVTKIQQQTASEYGLLRGMFPENALPVNDSSGVRAALAAVQRALGKTANVRAFLNGSGNILGLDPNFVIFMQGSTGTEDTYDILIPNVYASAGGTQPLNVALAHLTTAEDAYKNFRTSVDKVVEDLGNLEFSYGERFEAITGFKPNDVPGFDGYNPKAGISSSELATVERTIASLVRRRDLLATQSANFTTGIARANEGVKLAQDLGSTIETAHKTYFDNTKSSWDDAFLWAGTAAGSAAATDAVYAAAGVDTFKSLATLAVVAAGVTNTGLQVKAATVAVSHDRTVDRASVNMQTTIDKADAALTVLEGRLTVDALGRDLQGLLVEQEDSAVALSQAHADRARLIHEVEQIRESLDSNTAEVRGRFYADPIHLVRSENAILEADAAFFNAQRWLFYLLRSLEYKWSSKFQAPSPSGRNYDAGNIFKLRNAKELKDFLDAMVGFNTAGGLGAFQNFNRLAVISLKNQILAPNPRALALTTTTDDGYRVDTGVVPAQTVTQQELFRRKLNRARNADGDIEIPINTTTLNLADFFLGPVYSNTAVPPVSPITSAGQWRDKIIYVKVNIVDPTYPAAQVDPTPIRAKIVYAGTSMLRTRIAPCPSLAARLTPAGNQVARDFPGELIVFPYRKYDLPTFDSVVFDVREENAADGSFARSRSAIGSINDTLSPAFQFNDFKELSVAATGWKLLIFRNSLQDQNNSFARINPDTIEDIQFIISHRNANRLAATPCN